MSQSHSMPEADKTFVLVLSTMRSGSTLLKALLASLPDVSQLPEIDFQKYQGPDAARRMAELAPEPIVLLKRPAWFNETRRYPRLPSAPGTKRIILARDVHTNTLSLRKMVLRSLAPFAPAWVDRWIARRYWAPIYGRLRANFPTSDPSNFWIRYEDLVQDPLRHTEALFRFIGSSRPEGIDTYQKPDNYEWRWGSDDGGPKIKSLKVQAHPPAAEATRLLPLVASIPEVERVRTLLGYS